MIYDVRHLTTVQYAGLVRLARFNLRLKPAPWPSQRLLSYELTIDPSPSTIQEETGPYLVNRNRLTLRDPIARLSIGSCFRVEVSSPAVAVDLAMSPSVGNVKREALERRDLSPESPARYLYDSPMARNESEIAQWARTFFDSERPIVTVAEMLMEAIHADFSYDDEATATDTPPITAFRARRGVCQDFTHIMIIAARAHAIPAAYVSGYLRTLPPPGQPRLVGADAMHAWVNLWCGNTLGWVGFDPTNNLIVGSDHIFTAMGRDYGDIAPVDGVFHGGSGQTMEVSVDVEPVS